MSCGNKRTLFVFSIVTAIVIFSGQLSSLPAHAASTYTLVPAQYGMQLKTPDGRVIFEYVTKKPENIGLTSPSAAYFDPVNTPSGERVTNTAPDDHPHHRGIFLGFLDSEFHQPTGTYNAPPNHRVHDFDVHRADFWSWGFYAPRDGRVIQNRDIKLVSADSKHAQIEIHNDWLIENHKWLAETDEVTATQKEGVFVIDIYYKLAPVVDYVLNEASFGGFAVQAQKNGDWYYSTASGKVNLPPPTYDIPDSDWPSEPWYDYTIHLKSDGKVVGIAVLDHPLNPPTRWQNTVWLLNPCITSFGPKTIHPDEPLMLRYRIVVHDGPSPTEVLQKLSEEWRGMQSVPGAGR
jgi:Methane oxygenase PmoA